MNQLKSTPGIYVLVIEAICDLIITAKHKWKLKAGLYLYFGSAKGKTASSLGNRLIRHLNDKKAIFWHIDYMTSLSKTEIIIIYYNTKPEVTECTSLQDFMQNFHESKIIPNFGSSDCKSNCGGHLIFLSNNRVVLPALDTYFIPKGWFKA